MIAALLAILMVAIGVVRAGITPFVLFPKLDGNTILASVAFPDGTQFPSVQVRWEGQQEQTRESIGSLFRGFGVAVLVMFVLLSFELKSYWQPLLILMVIPFGVIGAIAGHALLGMPLTMFSMFGLVGLTGIVVNDLIVLVDFINAKLRRELPIEQALQNAGTRRFRPVMLTTVTTVGGLLPILLETSLQAQILISVYS